MDIIFDVLFSILIVITIVYLFIIYLQFSSCYTVAHRLDFLSKDVVLPWYSWLIAPNILVDGLSRLNYFINYYSTRYNYNSLPSYLASTGYQCCPANPMPSDPKCYNWWPQRIYS